MIKRCPKCFSLLLLLLLFSSPLEAKIKRDAAKEEKIAELINASKRRQLRKQSHSLPSPCHSLVCTYSVATHKFLPFWRILRLDIPAYTGTVYLEKF